MENLHISSYDLFQKKLVMIRFYRRHQLSYENIAYIVQTRTEIIRAYCLTLLHEEAENN